MARCTTYCLRSDQAVGTGVKVEGPFKVEHYRY